VSTVPLITVLIISWNSELHLQACLSKLFSQTYQNFEIILLNNDSLDIALDEFDSDKLQIIQLGRNLGFAVANNIGARLARGKWIALLNADAFPEPGWLENFLKSAEQNPQYIAFSSRQIQHNVPHLLDGAGDSYHMTGMAWRRYYNRPIENYGLLKEEVFSACPAAALYSCEEFLEIGGFDEDYFSYFEDVDLGFRLRLNGAKCLYVPEAVVHHVGSASTGKRSDFSVYYGYRNMIWTFVKNMPSPYIWIFLPLHIATILFFTIYLTGRGQGSAIWHAVFDAFVGMPKMLKKRKGIQKNIRIKPHDLLRIMSTGLIEPFQEFVKRNRVK
jgi:GT2 family glycosyltransferase